MAQSIIIKLALLTAATVLLIANSWLFHSMAVGIIALAVYLFLVSILVGGLFIKQEYDLYIRFTIGLLITLALIILLGAVFFYVWEFNNTSISIVALTLLILLFFLKKKENKRTREQESVLQLNQEQTKIQSLNQQSKISNLKLLLLITGYLLLVAGSFIILFQSQTTEPIRSPWEIVPSSFFILYFLATITLSVIILLNKPKKLPVTSYQLLVTLHLFLTFSITAIIYQLNYGFDPFIHQATEKILAATGTISPKPLLYVGQYTLVVWVSKLTGIAIPLIDRFLAPILFSLLFPPILKYVFTKRFNFSSIISAVAVLSIPLLLLPFFFSVPQTLANVFLLLTVLLSLARMPYGVLYLFGVVTFFLHPLSGIPLIIYLLFFTLTTHRSVQQLPLLTKRAVIIVSILGSLVALPLALSIGGALSPTASISLNAEQTYTQNLTLASWVPFYSPYHLVYFFKENHIFLILLAILAGIILLVRTTHKKIILPLAGTAMVLMVDIVLFHFFKFPVIAYETQEFINRFWQIILFFLLPIILYAIHTLLAVIEKTNSKETTAGSITKKTKIYSKKERLYALLPVSGFCSNSRSVRSFSVIFFLALFLTSSVYLLYPRADSFAKSRAYATSQYDVEAVQWIEQDAAGREYVVLANQAVSAAAIKELGFKKYFEDSRCQVSDVKCQVLFFYPIPTTSPLYQLYLDMVYIAPTKERLQHALDISGADTGYFVINNYWLDAKKRIVQAQEEQFDAEYIIENGKIYIFRLDKN